MDETQKDHFYKILQETIHNLPLETRIAYEKCMKGTALLVAIGEGMFAGICTYAATYNWSKQNRRVITALMSLTGLWTGRLIAPVFCMQKYLPMTEIMLKTKLDSERSYAKIDQESKFLESPETFPEQELEWSNYDNYDSGNQFTGTSNVLEEDLSLDKPLNLKQNVTYESLRKQHREKYLGRISQGQFQRKDTTFKPETKEESFFEEQ